MNLPKPNSLVMAFLEGASHHVGDAAGWKRSGWAEMVRWEYSSDYTVKDGWSRKHYDAALKRIGADYADITKWVYFSDLGRIPQLLALIEPANRAHTWLSMLSGIGANLPEDKANGLYKTIRDLYDALEAVDGSDKRDGGGNAR